MLFTVTVASIYRNLTFDLRQTDSASKFVSSEVQQQLLVYISTAFINLISLQKVCLLSQNHFFP